MRRLLAVFAILACWSLASAQRVGLVVIRSSRAQPRFDPVFAFHFDTVLWPAFLGKTGSNRLLSLLSGEDWRGEDFDLAFRAAPDGASFIPANGARLRRSGYLDARAELLQGMPVFAVSRPVGQASVNQDALLLATGKSLRVGPAPYGGPWPSRGLFVFEAENWDEAATVAARVGGRVLIVELPGPDRGWASFFERGHGWPPGLPTDSRFGIPGLLAAKDAGRLLLRPESFRWAPRPASADPTARWFEHVRSVGPVLMSIVLAVLAFVFASATYCIQIERRGPLAAALLVAVLLAPAALLLLGWTERFDGIDAWAGLLAAIGVGLGLLNWGLGRLFRVLFPGAHPLLAAASLGLAACLLGDPKWSLLSALFGYPGFPVSGEALGVFVGYLTGVVAFSRGSTSAAAWYGRAAVAASVLAARTPGSWLGTGEWTWLALPAIALSAGEGWMRWPMLVLLALLPHARSDPWRHGFAWAPLGCIAALRDARSVDAFAYVTFLIYPGLWALVLSLLYLASFADRFVWRQLRGIVRADPRLRALAWAAAGLAAYGAFDPVALPGALFVAYGALICLFFAGASAL